MGVHRRLAALEVEIRIYWHDFYDEVCHVVDEDRAHTFPRIRTIQGRKKHECLIVE